jgi:hypothetical protein
MGKRREPRTPFEVGARIFGTDCEGKVFSESVTSVDLSLHGAKLKGVKARLATDELVGVACGRNKGNFRVKWAGQPGTPSEGQVGLMNLNPEKQLWEVPLLHSHMDNFQFSEGNERRRAERVKCSISVELHPKGQTVIWGLASDLSLGGCFVEMHIPLKAECELEIVLWLEGNKLRLAGSVASSSPGFGIGVRFADVSEQDLKILREQVQRIVQPVG